MLGGVNLPKNSNMKWVKGVTKTAPESGGSPWSGKDSNWYSQAEGQLPSPAFSISDFLKSTFTSAAGSAILKKFGAGGGNPYVTGGLMLADFLYNQYKPATEAEKRTSLWQAEREKRLSQAQKMAMGLRKGLTQDQRIEAKQRATEAARANLGRAGRMGVGGAAFDRGISEQQQKLEDDLARKQRMQNVMMANQMDQRIDEQIPAIMQYYQQQGPPAIEGLLGDLQDLMAHDPEVSELTRTLVRLGGKEGLASLIEKLTAQAGNTGNVTPFTPKTPVRYEPTSGGTSKNPNLHLPLERESVWVNPLVDRLRREYQGTEGL